MKIHKRSHDTFEMEKGAYKVKITVQQHRYLVDVSSVSASPDGYRTWMFFEFIKRDGILMVDGHSACYPVPAHENPIVHLSSKRRLPVRVLIPLLERHIIREHTKP